MHTATQAATDKQRVLQHQKLAVVLCCTLQEGWMMRVVCVLVQVGVIHIYTTQLLQTRVSMSEAITIK